MVRGFKKYLADGLLIVFSVLFALFINKLAENYQTSQERDVALSNIKQELELNHKAIQAWHSHHQQIQNRITAMLQGRNDSLISELKKYKTFNLGVLTQDKTLVESILSNTAWETAKSTGIISEFDFELIQRLTATYELQETLTEKTLSGIVQLLFDQEFQDLSQLETNLVQLKLRFGELVGQEWFLKNLYKDTIGAIDKEL